MPKRTPEDVVMVRFVPDEKNEDSDEHEDASKEARKPLAPPGKALKPVTPPAMPRPPRARAIDATMPVRQFRRSASGTSSP